MTWDIIRNNLDKPWDYTYLSDNPNISWEIVDEYKDLDWDYYSLLVNPMTRSKEEFIRNKFQKWFTRSELKAELMAVVWHPKNFEKFKYLDPETFGEDF